MKHEQISGQYHKIGVSNKWSKKCGTLKKIGVTLSKLKLLSRRNTFVKFLLSFISLITVKMGAASCFEASVTDMNLKGVICQET